MDSVLYTQDKLPVELFIDFDKWIQPVIDKVTLAKEGKGPMVLAEITFYDKNMKPSQLDVRLTDFNPESLKFMVESLDLRIQTWRSRVYLTLKDEDPKLIATERVLVEQRMMESIHYLRFHRLILKEFLHRFPYIRMNDHFREHISMRLRVNPILFSEELAR